MAVVTSSRKKVWNRVAIAAVLVIAIVFLSPLYWIGSTAFKPRSLATTVPPTVFFQPEITPFIKLFTKRVQLTKPVDPAVYDAAPWYEKRIYDGGERILRVGPNIQLSQYPNRFMNSLIVAIISTFIAVSMGTITAYGFSRFKMAGEADLAVLHPVDAHAAAHCRRHPDVPDVPGRWPERQPHRPHHPLYRFQPVLLGLADEGLHG